MKKIFKITGMACKHCAGKVEAKASSLVGVSSVQVNLSGGEMTVEFDETKISASEIASAVSSTGFPTEEV